jgi:hypothetical protein
MHSSSDHYRVYADECMKCARKTATDAERETFLKLAHEFLRAADVLDTKSSYSIPAAQYPFDSPL